MSDFLDALIELLPEHNALKRNHNDLHKVLSNTVGVWYDERNVQTFYDNLFINYATGEWLDLHGRDYGVIRQVDETDEHYRERIIQEKTEHLTPHYLETIYNIGVFFYVDSFSASDNDLTSDNPYINEYGYMLLTDDDGVKSIIEKKFVLGSDITWL